MRQKSFYRYEAAQGEAATFLVIPHLVAPLVVASHNRVSLPNVGTEDTPKFEAELSPAPGDLHKIDINCTFAPGSATGAYYKIVVSDGVGNTWTNVPPVRPTDRPDVIFTITVC